MQLLDCGKSKMFTCKSLHIFHKVLAATSHSSKGIISHKNTNSPVKFSKPYPRCTFFGHDHVNLRLQPENFLLFHRNGVQESGKLNWKIETF